MIARNEQGNPTDPADIARLAEQEHERDKLKDSNVDWEDIELQADIQAQTGIQLVRPKKGKGKKCFSLLKNQDKYSILVTVSFQIKMRELLGKGRPKKYPGLTDLKKTSDSCRTRLQNKVLSA